jgi:uncharacterized protein (DUF2141 family)
MKKTALFTMALLVSMAQFLSAQTCQKLNESVLNNTPTIYLVDDNNPSSGYISGHNTFGDRAQANFYTNPYAQGNIDSVWLYFGVAKASNANKFITVTIWDNTGTGNKPNNIIASQNVSISNISTTGATAVRFDPPITVTTNFYVGFSYTYASGDTVAIYTSEDGEPVSAAAWYEEALTVPASWFPYSINWSYDVSHFIVAKLCEQQPGCPTIVASATADDNTSCNQPNGKITVTATDGVAPYQYNIGGGNQSSNEFENLAAGDYIITVTDDNGCTATSSLTTVGDDFLLPNIVVDNIVSNTSCTNSNGSIELTASGGVSPYSFVLELPNGDTETGSGLVPNTYPIVDLIIGAYNLEITGDNGCVATTTFTITDNLPSIVLAEVDNNDNTSCTNPNGAFTVDASGGQGNYTYSDGNTSNANGVFSGLDAGNYDVTVTDDASGCTATTSVAITSQTNAPLITFSNVVANTSCVTPFNGSAQVTISGATVSFAVEAEGPGGFSYNLPTAPAGSLPLNALEPGDYSVTVTDGNGCFTVEEVTIDNNSTVLSVFETNNTDNTSCATANGAFTVEANGGTPAYVYEVASIGTSTTGTFENLDAGNYDVIATDDEGCSGTTTVTINDNLPVVSIAETDNTDNTSCATANGAFTVEAFGGTPAYIYEVTSIGTSTTGTFENLTAGSYNVIATDNDGCSGTTTVTINDNLPVITIDETNNTDNTSCTNANGTFTVEANGGNPAYVYEVTGIGTSTTGIFENLEEGNYDVVVTDDDGCIATTSVTITDASVSPSITVDAVTGNTSCTAPFNGNVEYTVTSSLGTFSYSLEGSNGFTDNNSGLSDATYNITNLEANNYSITVTDDNGCIAVETFTIDNDALAIDVTELNNTDNTICTGGNGSFTVDASGGTPNYTYAIAGTTTVDGIFENLTGGTYTVTATDDNGCTGTIDVEINNNTVNPLLSVGSVASNTACTAPFNGAFTVNASSATAPYTYDAGAGTNATGAFTALEAGTYNVTVTDNNGCTATIDVDVVDNLPVLDLSVSSQAASSQTAVDGEATVNVTGGTPGYTYSWDDNNAGTAATVTGLLTGTYNVTVTDNNGCTATESVFVDFVVGIANAVNINTQVYPNPTNNNINIHVSLPKASNVAVELYNALGALVTKETHADVVQVNTIFQLINYDNGIYFLKVKAENEVSTYKVLLNK